MYFSFSSFLLLCCVTLSIQESEDTPQKSASKISDFKAKLSRTELSSKSSASESLKIDDEDVTHPVVDLGISVPPEHANDTYKQGHHVYYNSTFYADPEVAKTFWIDLDSLQQEHVITHNKLSNSHRQATTIELSFDFPFYGSNLRNVTIATGGFLYMGDYLHNWIAATQYIAPLMANFDTSLSTESVIKYADNGTAFIVQWEKVSVQERANDGAFTFQATLLKNGDMIFAYKDVPYPVSSISDNVHPVKVGISDAYILERAIFFVRRKTVYEYHRVQIEWDISNSTAIYFIALPTCAGYKDCSSCLSADPKLECGWCDSVKRCSDGIDRLRQEWVVNGCTIKKVTSCDATTTVISTNKSHSTTYSSKGIEVSTKQSISKSSSKYSTYKVENVSVGNYQSENKFEETAHLIQEDESTAGGNISPGAIVTIVLFLFAVISAIAWVAYAYKFPQTPSGQFLIKYRPSQWTVKKDENTVTTSSRHL